MDVSPVKHIAFRVNRMYAFSFAKAIFDTPPAGFIKYFDLLCTSAFRIICCMDTGKGGLTTDFVFLIIVFVFNRTSQREKDYILVLALDYVYIRFILQRNCSISALSFHFILRYFFLRKTF